MERRTRIMIVVVAVIIGAMNGIFGYSALSAVGVQCPDGPECAAARQVVYMGFGLAAAGALIALWFGRPLLGGGK